MWFWKAINAGDRVESALKDMAVVMKQLDRTEEAIEAIKSFRCLCPKSAQESLDNVLIDLFKVRTTPPTPTCINYSTSCACVYIYNALIIIIQVSSLKVIGMHICYP